ncbi:hypothetical protein CHS0354_038928 [Potamilus streckersoni]|uniref:DUF2723 domain-containing protein n=1 Tax=Potamilus streckersoni TaxID=2493646 RepID=A0AAE0VMF9_9BIVA|nr:hypothetical protein CHS0354_038928 [Potamilus streckersoni]
MGKKRPRESVPKFSNDHQKESTDKDDSVEGISDFYVYCSIGGMAMVIYTYTTFPGLPGGDSGELITAAHELGVSHPPGYPLFTILSWLAISVLPIGNVAWRVSFLNCILSAVAAAVFSATILRLKCSLGAAVFGTFLFFFGKLAWTWSITAEVFGMNNLFVALLLYLMVCFEDAKEPKQFTSLNLPGLFQLSLCLLCGLLPYLYLPLSAYLRPGRWTWGDQTTLTGFLTHFLRKEYGTFDLSSSKKDGASLLNGLRAYLLHYIEEYSVIGCCFTLMGLHALFCRLRLGKEHCLLVSLLMCVVYLMFFSWRANLDLDNPLFLGVVERFWMQSDAVLLLISALGFADACRFIKKMHSVMPRIKFDVILSLVVAAIQIQKNISICNQRNNTVVQEFAYNVMDSMPQGAIILTHGDLPSNTLRYLYLCEHYRPDLQIFDQEILTYEWSVPMMRDSYPRIQFPGDLLQLTTGIMPDGRRSFDFTTFLNANYNSAPIFACIGVQKHEMSWTKSYDIIPHGCCYRMVKKGEKLDWKKLTKEAEKMSQNWTYPYDGFDKTSWERVATNEMWHARISTAFSLYDEAMRLPVPKRTEFLIYSHDLYHKVLAIIEGTELKYPSHLHKNFALVCEKLLSLQHHLDPIDLLQKSIRHFEIYAAREPSDPDHGSIVKIIKSMKKQLENNIAMKTG